MKVLTQEVRAGLSAVFDARRSEGLELIERQIEQALDDSQGTVSEMCRHIFSAGGKRIRPLMVLYSGMVFTGKAHLLLNAAAAAELIHMASLVHDDIIDKSFMRRSKPSINKVWGNDFAVLCGDYLFAKAFGILSGNMLMESMNYMVEAIQNMCHGEILQAEDRFNINAGIDKYYVRIAKKTAIFLQCCCKSGAASAGAGKKEVDLIGQFGLHTGYAFQIIDDILDICGDTRVMGKPKGEDLTQGNITLPLILMLEHAEYGQWLREIIEKRDFSGLVIDDLCSVIRESGIIDEAYEIAGSHVETARNCLGQLPENKYTMLLNNITDMLNLRMN